ncbi:MAG: outer membrane protein transport protein [Epsilonproteobacteria bacterium]|nr:outer membrane protein transport protein [Campylobacterota bacterium]
MKRIVVMSMLAASVMYATNGDNMIGVGVQSRAMGGAGVGMGMGTDSVFRNPAWIVDLKGFNASFGATAFMPDVSANIGGPNYNTADTDDVIGSGVSVKSDADFSIIPTVSHSDHINESLSYGVGMFGVSGMGVDYRNETSNPGLGNMRTSLQYMRFVPSLSYKVDNWRLGAGLTVAYGALNMAAVTQSPTDGSIGQRSGGLSEDIGFGGQVGLGYYVMPGVSLGAYYQTQVDTEYENVFDFNGDGTYNNLKLSQPAEAGIGIGYTSDCKCYSLTLDYRRIMWSDADGYDMFEWDDQDVIAVGGSYNVNDALVLRAGYNYAKSPLNNKTFTGSTAFSAPMLAYFNTLGFPAYTESHFTTGLSYQITKSTGIDFAYVYAPEVEESQSEFGPGTTLSATNEQNSLSVALRFTF